MRRAGIGAALGLFVFKFVQFAEHIHGNPDVVFGETLDAGRIVQEDVGIENVVFACHWSLAGVSLFFPVKSWRCFDRIAEKALLGRLIEGLWDVL